MAIFGKPTMYIITRKQGNKNIDIEKKMATEICDNLLNFLHEQKCFQLIL